MNGDGRADLVTADQGSDDVAVFIGNGDGTFASPFTIAVGSRPAVVRIADVTNDNLYDLITANQGSSNLSILASNGDGTFQAAINLPLSGAPDSITLADVNGDTLLDLVAASSSAGSISILLSNGDGTFQGEQSFAAGVQTPTSIFAGDLNADGSADIVLTDAGLNCVAVLLGNGNGSFQGPQTFSAGTEPESLTVLDLDLDGSSDIVAGNYGSNDVSILLGNGNGTFKSQQTLMAGTAPVSVAAGDLNADGKLDFVVANEGSGNISVFQGNGNGTFAPQQTFAGGATLSAMVLSDVNTDVRPDVVAASALDGVVQVLLNVTDTTPPALPSTPDLTVDSDSGSSNIDNVTNVTTPTFSGTAEDGSTVSIYADGTVVGSGVATGGSYTIAISAISDGDHTITAMATDADGNDSAISGGLLVRIDTIAPGVPTVPDLASSSDSGTSNLDNVTNVNTPTFVGAAESDSRVSIFADANPVGSGIAVSGNYSIPVAILSDGNHLITATATDLAGNVGAASTSLSVLIDTIAPTAPSIPDLPAGIDSGISSNDNITNATAPTLTGTAENNSTVRLFSDGISVGGGGASGGVYGIPVPAMIDGTHTITATATDLAGNTSVASSGLSLTIDTIAPPAPGTPDLNATSDTGISSTDNITFIRSPVFSGSAEANSSVSVFSDGSSAGSGTAVGGSYGIMLSILLAEGNRSITARATDVAGNIGQTSSALLVTIDTTPPATPSVPDLVFSSDSGISNTDNITNAAAPVFTVTADPNSIVNLLVAGTSIGSATAGGGSAYSVTASMPFQGQYSIGASAMDVAGNTSNQSLGLPVTYDTIAPSLLTVPDLADLSDSGSSNTDNITNIVSPTFTGSAEANSIVRIFSDGVLAGTGSATAGGAYSVLLSSSLTNGAHSITATVTDAAGNTAFTSVATLQTVSLLFAPLSMAAADLNADGKLDIAAGVSGRVEILLGNGNGTFQTPRTYVTGSAARGIAVGDINRDGKADLAVADSGTGMHFLFGNGNGTFVVVAPLTLSGATVAVALGDVNNDGEPDIVSVDGSTSVVVDFGWDFQGEGTELPIDDSASSVALADVNGDGKLDILAGGATVSVLLGNGDWTFKAAQTFGVISADGSVIPVDMDGDVKLDIVTNGSVLLGNGNGSFRVMPAFAASASAAVADVDLDGKLDAIVTRSSIDSASLYLGNGNGTFRAPLVMPAGHVPKAVLAGNFDGAGGPEIVLADGPTPNVLSFLYNAPSNPAGLVVTIDTSAPGGPSTPDLSASSDSGSSNTDNITNLTTPMFVGTAEANSTVRVYADGALVGSAVATSGNYSVTVSGLIDGTHVIQATATDIAGNSSPPPSGAPLFLPQQTYLVGNFPLAVATADTNGDGKADIIAGSSNGSTVSILLGNGNGTFQSQQVASAGGGPWALAVGDLNADGKLDLVAANFGSSNVATMLGNGNGTFQTARTFAAGLNPVGVALADFNGDGKLDVAVAEYNSNAVAVLLGNGNGTLVAQQFVASIISPQSIAAGDVDGDGKADLVAVSPGAPGSIAVYIGSGSGTFSSRPALTASVNFAALSDVNADGRLDVVAPSGVFLGNGNGSFQSQQSFSPGAGSNWVAVADFNADGKADVATASFGTSASVYLGNGDGTFQGQLTFAVGQSAYSIAAADFNGDGRADLVTPANVTTPPTVSVLLSTPPPPAGLTITIDTVAPAPPSLPDLASGSDSGTSSSDNITNIAASTFTGTAEAGGIVTIYVDGVPVATGNAAGGTYAVTISALADGGHAVTATTTDQAGNASAAPTGWTAILPRITVPLGNTPSSLIAVDLNLDGRKDIVVSDIDTSNLGILFGNGNGTFQAQRTLFVGENPSCVATADLNGDGKPDLIAATSPYLSILLGNGNGTFRSRLTYLLGSSVLSMTLADVNGDTYLDAIATDFFPSTVDVFLGNGNGTFKSAQFFNIVNSGPYSVATADVTGDGKPDIVTANLYTNDVSILRGNGNGTFQSPQSVAAPGGHSVAISDLNGDGRPDLITNTNVLIGNGNGTFKPPQAFTVYATKAVPVDLNADGRKDLIVGDSSGFVDVFLGLGDGTFTNPQSFAVGTNPADIASADFNGDNVLDLATADYDSNDVSALMGNLSGTLNLNIVVDTVAPSSPSVPDLIASSDSGSSATDDVTNVTIPTFAGTAENASLVRVYSDGGLVGSGYATGTSYLTTSSTPLSDGVRLITATATDVAGNSSVPSAPLSVTIDTIANATAPDLARWTDSGILDTDNLTNVVMPTFTGTADVGSTVKIYSDGIQVGSGVATGGNYSVAVSTALTNGTHNLTATALDIAGNTSAVSVALPVTIDTVVPAAPGTPDLTAASDHGTSSIDNLTNLTLPGFSGIAETNSLLNLYSDGALVGNATTNSGGSYSITATTALADGLHTIKVQATDLAGNVGDFSGSLPVTIDTVAPTVTAGYPQFNYLTGPQSLTYGFSESVGGTQSAGGFVLSNLTTLALVPLVVVYDPNTLIATLTWPAASNGTGILADGNYNIPASALVTDLAGNVLTGSSFNFYFLGGDANHDRAVDSRDLYVLSSNWGMAVNDFSQGDFNYDGAVDGADLSILASHWQQTLATPSSPLPGSLVSSARRTATRVVTLIAS